MLSVGNCVYEASEVSGLVVTCDQIAKTPVFTGVLAVRSRLTQALGRLPWFAPFFLRARRLRPVLPISKPPCNNCKESQSLIPQRCLQHSAASLPLPYSVSRTVWQSRIAISQRCAVCPLRPAPAGCKTATAEWRCRPCSMAAGTGSRGCGLQVALRA